MPPIYLDENIDRLLGVLLLLLGYDIAYARELHPSHSSDHIHLAFAARTGRILVTHDRGDFQLLHRAWCDWFAEFAALPPSRHGGILLLPQSPVLNTSQAATIVHAFLADASPSTLSNRLYEWTATDGWREQFPPSGSLPDGETS
jgi:Domain of unknown function (DUF5615)